MSDELENTITLRQKIDKDIVDNQREDRRRLDEVVSRLSNADARLASMQDEFLVMREFGSRVQDVQTDIVERLTALSEQFVALSTRFVEHIQSEEDERQLMKAIATQLQQTAIQLKENSVRTSYLERGIVLLTTACTAVVTGNVGWIIHHLSN
jgi:hypothetical protein